MKNLFFCLAALLLSITACLRQPNNTELDITGMSIEYNFEPSTKDVTYQVLYINQIGSQMTERVPAGQSFNKKFNTNQTMGFKVAEIVVQNLDTEKALTGDISLKRRGTNKSETITVVAQTSYKVTDQVYR